MLVLGFRALRRRPALRLFLVRDDASESLGARNSGNLAYAIDPIPDAGKAVATNLDDEIGTPRNIVHLDNPGDLGNRFSGSVLVDRSGHEIDERESDKVCAFRLPVDENGELADDLVSLKSLESKLQSDSRDSEPPRQDRNRRPAISTELLDESLVDLI